MSDIIESIRQPLRSLARLVGQTPGQFDLGHRNKLPSYPVKVCALLAVSAITIGCGVMLDGKIYSLREGVVLPMQIETSRGHGKITSVHPKTGERFEGTYSGVSSGSVGVGFLASGGGQSAAALGSVSSTTANAIATMIGDKGTVLDCIMDIQKGIRPHGLGTCKDNNGSQYRLQF